MNSLKFLFISICLPAVMSFSQDWDSAIEKTKIKGDPEQELRLEIGKLREHGMRYAFQPPPDGSKLGWMKDVELPQPNDWKFNGKIACIESGGGKGRGAVVRFNAPRPGKMFLWFRYRDAKRQVNYTGKGSLVVSFRQNGKPIGTWKLPRTNSPLCDRNGWRKYGVGDLAIGWPVSVWQDAAVEVPKAGEVEAELTVVDGGFYSVQAWVSTPDPLYEPLLEDFTPLWIRFTSLPGEKYPFKARLYKGIRNHAPIVCHMTNSVALGKDSGWFYVSRFAGCGRTLECTFTDGRKDAQNRFLRAELSRTPNAKDVFYSDELHGHGNRLTMQIMEEPWYMAPNAPYTVRSDTSESKKSLEKVKELSAQKGNAPRRFRFEMPIAVGVGSYQAYVNEMKVSLGLGCRVQPDMSSLDTSSDPVLAELQKKFFPIPRYRSPLPFGYYENGYDKCICNVKFDKIAEWTKKTYEGKTGAGFSMWWDEPMGHAHRDCVIPCTKAYREFLKSVNISPKDVGAKDWDHVFPVQTAKWEDQRKSMDAFAEKFKFSKSSVPDAIDNGDGLSLDEDASAMDYDPSKAAERYYWSQRYHLTKLRRFLSFATAEVEKYNPKVIGTACLSPDIVDFYDGIRFGTDWFDFFEHRGFNCVTSEDWHNVSGDYAVCGFLVDFLRGCARRQKLPIRMATVMCNGRTPWEVTAKSFTEIGRGAKDLWFYGYGPSYVQKEETSNEVPGMYAAVKSVTFPVGAVENVLLDGKMAKGYIALLYSVTSDIRAHAEGKAGRIGADRIWTDLLLTHLGRDVDIINEDGLSDFLKGYRFLWCGEDAIRRDCVKPLKDWIAAGGTLFLTDGALVTDEFGQKLGFDTKSGVRGKGRIVAVGRAGNEYRGGSKPSQKAKGFREYPESVRAKYAKILDEAKVPVSVSSSVYNVQGHLFRGMTCDVLVVANWSGLPQDVVLTIPGVSYRGVDTYNGETAVGVKAGKDYAVKLLGLKAGDCIKLLR